MAGEGAATGAAAGTAIAPGVGTLIGGAIGALGDVTAGLVSSSQSSHDASRARHLARQQFNSQMDESIQRRVADALKAGINPLAALGYSGGASPTFHTDGQADGGAGIASGISGAGRHLSRMIEKLLEEKAVGDLEYDQESKNLDLESKRLENRILQQRLDANTFKPGVSEVSSIEPPSMQGEQMLFKPVYDLQGNPRLVINQDVMEMDSDNAAYRSSIATALKEALTNGQISASGRIMSDQLAMLIDQMYYDTTGKRIANLGQLYISPTEMYMVLGDEAKQWLGKHSD